MTAGGVIAAGTTGGVAAGGTTGGVTTGSATAVEPGAGSTMVFLLLFHAHKKGESNTGVQPCTALAFSTDIKL